MASALQRLAQDFDVQMRAASLQGPQAGLAARTSLATVGAVLIALALRLDDPWWAGITAIAILQGDIAATLTRSAERALGTVLGAGIGYLLAPTVAWPLLFQLTCGGIVAFTVYAQERSRASYAVLLGGVTAILVLFGTLSMPAQSLHLAVYRTLEVLTGIAVGCLVEYALGPSPGHREMQANQSGIFGSPLDAGLLAVAVTGGISVAFIPDIWETFQLPGFAQTPITAFVIVTASRHDPWLKALARSLGCLLGGLFGIAAMGLAGDAFPLWLTCLAGGLFVASFLQHGHGDAAYVGQQAGVAILLAMVQGSGASTDLLPAIGRLIGIFGGIVVVLAFEPLLAPLHLWLDSYSGPTSPRE